VLSDRRKIVPEGKSLRLGIEVGGVERSSSFERDGKKLAKERAEGEGSVLENVGGNPGKGEETSVDSS